MIKNLVIFYPQLLKKILAVFIITLVIAVIFAVFVFYPQLFQCKNTYKFKQYKIYFCNKNKISSQEQSDLKSVLSKTEKLLEKSDIFDPKVNFNLFLNMGNKSSFTLPLQFNKEAYAQTTSFFDNISAWNINLKTNEAFVSSGHHRPLSAVLAHESVHVLYDKHYTLRKKLLIMSDESERSTYGFMWKEEGYAEYIAGGSGINMKDGLQILNGHPNASYHPFEVDYFKYFLTIKYLIEVKKLSLDQIVHTKMDFNTVLRDAMNHFSDAQKT
ncbi:MAG: hypothetical protein K0U37_03700 [Gammaproteobacteria bacterium]|nr:hypothetical protein [Gammaproteobacteria bacterium]